MRRRMTMGTRRLLSALVLTGAALAMPGSEGLAAAAPRPAKKAGASAQASALPAETLAKLRSQDPLEVRAALDDARMAGKDAVAAVAPIAALLRSGLPYPLAEAALDTLGDIQSPDGSAVIAPYARHRELKVRRAAVRALAKAVGAGTALAAGVLRTALSDPDTQVRALAATGLGSLKAKAAVPDLFLALDHHVYEAAVSIGQLCGAADCDAFVGRLGKIPFDVETTGLDQLLFRPAAEVTDDQKVAIVTRVRDMGTRDANRFLRDVSGRWAKNGSAKVKRELDAAVLATLTSPGGS